MYGAMASGGTLVGYECARYALVFLRPRVEISSGAWTDLGCPRTGSGATPTRGYRSENRICLALGQRRPRAIVGCEVLGEEGRDLVERERGKTCFDMRRCS